MWLTLRDVACACGSVVSITASRSGASISRKRYCSTDLCLMMTLHFVSGTHHADKLVPCFVSSLLLQGRRHHEVRFSDAESLLRLISDSVGKQTLPVFSTHLSPNSDLNSWSARQYREFRDTCRKSRWPKTLFFCSAVFGIW